MFGKKEKTNKYNKKRLLSIITGFLIFLLLFTSFLFTAKSVYAQFSDPVAAAQRTAKFVWDKVSKAIFFTA